MGNEFDAFKNESATLQELAGCFVSFERKESELSGQYQQARSKMILIQQEALAGASVAKELKQARDDLEDFGYQIEACQGARESLKARMENKLMTDSRARLQSIPDEGDKLQAVIDDRYHNFIIQAARLAVTYAKLEGESGSISGSGNYHTIPRLPEITSNKLGAKRGGLFLAEYEKAMIEAKGEPSFKAKMRDLTGESTRLQKLLQDGPEEEVKRLLISSGSLLARGPEQAEKSNESTLPSCSFNYTPPPLKPSEMPWGGQTVCAGPGRL